MTMGDKSLIAWTDATWNPVTGCSKVSQGCKHCYAERIWPRVYPWRKFTDVQMHPERLDQPLRWRKPRMIFVNSMSDLFHETIPDEFINNVFDVMGRASQHIFQVLTKRPERMRDFVLHSNRPLSGGWRFAGPFPLPNVWLGVSVENQETADERIPVLLQVPAAIRFLSCEPLLAGLDLRTWLHPEGRCDECGELVRSSSEAESCECGSEPSLPRTDLLHWVIIGGESGPKARPMNALWCHSLLEQCRAAGVPFFMKQGSQANWPKFKDFESFPPELRVREYPS